MTQEEAIIAHAMSCNGERRLLVTINGAEVNVAGDNRQPGRLRDEAAEGGGIYFTDGSTWEALARYDTMDDLKRIVVYRIK
jgi:hypothetical protein